MWFFALQWKMNTTLDECCNFVTQPEVLFEKMAKFRDILVFYLWQREKNLYSVVL
jgi:hypothetical protein